MPVYYCKDSGTFIANNRCHDARQAQFFFNLYKAISINWAIHFSDYHDDHDKEKLTSSAEVILRHEPQIVLPA
jgi:hypothetical protein